MITRELPIRPQATRRKNMIEGLTRVREDWEITADGQSLIDVKASVGLLLYDVATALDFTAHEKVAMLGWELFKEIDEIIEARQYRPV